MTPSISLGRTWEAAESPELGRLTVRFETAWRSNPLDPPRIEEFLPRDVAQRSPALLALLRVELALRFETDPGFRVESLRSRHPEIEGETLTALVYEEYCLREERGEQVQRLEYEQRFPSIAAAARRVFDIHDLVGVAPGSTADWLRSASFSPLRSRVVEFPEAGQTIGGFRLVEELGRGSFARVYRGEERRLADRPVALKVSRRGSSEPQLLARLQHTNIVPIHSYLTDQATGLHLLCMPYYGRITLERLLADPQARVVRTGAELSAAIDRLGSTDSAAGGGWPARSSGRRPIDSLDFNRAIAWWGARLAEALQYAHDRGVLHRDIKPSNILLTPDGLPMLLDFNLALEPLIDRTAEFAESASEETPMGGTLVYMAPEQLDDLISGEARNAEASGDVYSLGVVLFEALVGARPFSVERGRTLADTLLRTAAERRREVPRIRLTHPEVPAAIEAVVRRCLEPDPAKRYAKASELAVDLQAFIDDEPLRVAVEPLFFRTIGRLRRNRLKLAIVAPILIAIMLASRAYRIVNVMKLQHEQNLNEIRSFRGRGADLLKHRDYARARDQFEYAVRLAGDRPEFAAEASRARREAVEAATAVDADRRAREFLEKADSLKFRLLDLARDRRRAGEEVDRALMELSGNERIDDEPSATLAVAAERGAATKFHVAAKRAADLALLDEKIRIKIQLEINDLLFLRVLQLISSRGSGFATEAIAVCERASAFAESSAPWRALLADLKARPGEFTVASRDEADDPAAEKSPRVCFQWSLLREFEKRPKRAEEWLERALQIDESNFWSHYYMGYFYDRAGKPRDALDHYDAAIALRPESPWPRYNRGQLLVARGAPARAAADLEKAIELAKLSPGSSDPRTLDARLNLALARQRIGDFRRAKSLYNDIIIDRSNPPAARRAARLNLAKLEADSGRSQVAIGWYLDVLSEFPNDSAAESALALLELTEGRANEAEARLSRMIERSRSDPRLWADRAIALLLLNRPDEAANAAARSVEVDPSPRHLRIQARVLLATGRRPIRDRDDPDSIRRLPFGGDRLERDVRLALAKSQPPVTALEWTDQASLLSLVDRRAALAAADRAVALAPASSRTLLLRARILRDSGSPHKALADIQKAIDLDPADPRGFELRGLVLLDLGDPRGALVDFDRSLQAGVRSVVFAPRALALSLIRRDSEAVVDWTRYLASAPDDPEAYLGRAKVRTKIRQYDDASADLELALDWAGEDPMTLARIAVAYSVVATSRPDRVDRVRAITQKAIKAAIRGSGSRRDQFKYCPLLNPKIILPILKLMF